MEHFSLNDIWVSTVLVKSVPPEPPHRPTRVGEWSAVLTPLSARVLVRLEMPVLQAPEMWLLVMEEEPGPWVSAAKMVSRSAATVFGEATDLPWLFYLQFRREQMLCMQ